LCRVRYIQCAVSHAIARLVVQPLPEAGAPRHTYGVATCTYMWCRIHVV
jgi:hypothetical protein